MTVPSQGQPDPVVFVIDVPRNWEVSFDFPNVEKLTEADLSDPKIKNRRWVVTAYPAFALPEHMTPDEGCAFLVPELGKDWPNIRGVNLANTAIRMMMKVCFQFDDLGLAMSCKQRLVENRDAQK